MGMNVRYWRTADGLVAEAGLRCRRAAMGGKMEPAHRRANNH